MSYNVQTNRIAAGRTGVSGIALLLGLGLCFAGVAAQESPSVPPVPVEEVVGPPPDHMSETLRKEINNIVVIATRGPAEGEVVGTYEKGTAGLIDGAAGGTRIGRIVKEVGPVPVVIPIPILVIPGAIFGGLSGAAKREIQEFRDALTEELIAAETDSLTDDGLALDVFWGLRKLPNLNSKIIAPTAEVPADTDALLYVVFRGVEIDVQGKEAIITTSAEAKVRGNTNGRDVFSTVVYYQDRDTLRDWTDNNNALWREYVNYARHFLGREISAEVFDRIKLPYTFAVAKTDTASRNRKDAHQLVSKTLRPTLAWDLQVSGNDAYGAWTHALTEAEIFYDLEIYDNHRLIYFEEQLPDPRHTLNMDLEQCGVYRWSVRPSYHVDGDVRYGEWARFPDANDEAPKISGVVSATGIHGRDASAAPAYIQNFASLDIKCGRR